MQQAGEGGHPVELLVAHDAQIVDIALHLAQLGGEGIDFIAVTECDHPALQGILQHNAHPTGEHGQLVEAAQLIVGIAFEHVAAGEKGLRRNDAVDRLTAQLAGGLAEPQQAAGGMVYHLNTPLAIDDDHPLKDRLHHRLLLANQQANFPRLERKNLLLDTAGKVPGEDKQGDEQQDGGDKNIDHFSQSNAVEIADGDNTDHTPCVINDGRFAAQRDPEAAFANGGDGFPFQYRLVVAADQSGANPLRMDGMKQMNSLTVADDDKAGVAMGGDLLHKRLNRLWVVPADLLT